MDIRIPIGLLFSLVGALIAVWGALGSAASKLPERLGPEMSAINMNLWWGLVLLAFGLFMLGLAGRAACKARKAACGESCGCQ